MPTCALPDITLHYEIEGKGPPLLLIAGLASDSTSWGALPPALASDWTVIRPDNRCTGRTTPQDAPASIPIWAADCLALLDHLGIETAHVAGHSLGGLIGLNMVARARPRVKSLCLLATSPISVPRNDAVFDTLVVLRAPGMAPDLWLRAFLPWLFHHSSFDAPGALDAMVAMALAYSHGQGAAAMARQIAAMKVVAPHGITPADIPPTLALLAADDLLYPAALAVPGLQDFPAIRIETIPRAGHSIHWDAPDAVLAHLTAFLTGQEAAR